MPLPTPPLRRRSQSPQPQSPQQASPTTGGDEEYVHSMYETPQNEHPNNTINGFYTEDEETSETPTYTTPEPVYNFANLRNPETRGPFDNDPQLNESVQIFFNQFNDDTITEIVMNSPFEILSKKAGVYYTVANINFQTEENYTTFINEYILPLTEVPERIDGHTDFIEGQVVYHAHPEEPPSVARCTIVNPPTTRYPTVTLAKKSRRSLNIDNIVEYDSLSRNMGEFLKALAQGRATVVIAGLSGSGKTTLLEAMAHHFDPTDRVIIAEDTPEIRIQHAGVVSMIAQPPSRGDGDREITIEWIVKTINRMRPSRIIVGELRGAEAADFLVAANSGADGSMTTVHAGPTPQHALEKLQTLALKSSTARNESSILREIAGTVHIIVQLSQIDGKHYVTHIEEVSNTVTGRGTISTSPIFTMDRNSKRFTAVGRPSDSLLEFLRQRGVNPPPHLFA